MTRREFLKSGVGLASIIAAQKSPAYIKGLIAAFNTPFEGTTRWYNPYVTDGLTHMWDGIWNTGEGGRHNPNAGNIWKPLVGTLRMKCWGWNSTCGWWDNSMCGLDRALFESTYTPTIGSGLTIECCAPNFGGRTSRSCFCGILAGDGISNNFFLCVAGKTFGWIRKVPSAKEITAELINNPGFHTQTVSIDPNGHCLVSIDGKDSLTLDIPIDKFQYSEQASPGNHASTLMSTSEGSPTFYNARIYNRMLSADEISHNAMVDSERFSL